MADPQNIEIASLAITDNEDEVKLGEASEPKERVSNGLGHGDIGYRLEKLYDYMAGGHHPVHLGDILGPEGRYKVIHKFGSGGFANVWMARDMESPVYNYVALKILLADATTDDSPELRAVELKQLNLENEDGGHAICLALDHFRIVGPNGTHLCMVYPVLGPQAQWLHKFAEDPAPSLRKVALDTVQAMSCLHRHGICHGDLTAKNVLLRMKSLEGLSEERIFAIFGEPERVPVRTRARETPTDPSAVRYVVRAMIFNSPEAASYVLHEACIIDFGESYQTSSPPEDLGIPQSYRSVELMLDYTVGIGADLWALACTLFAIRAGRRLINNFDDDEDEHLIRLVLLLGPLPEPWWTTWEARKECFEDDPDAAGRAVETELIAVKQPVNGWAKPHVRSLRELAAEGGYYDSNDLKIFQKCDGVPSGEAEVFADLLEKLMRYKPEERMSAAEAVQHPWFKMDLGADEQE